MFGPFLLRLLTKTVCSTVCSHEWCSVVMIVGLGGPEGGGMRRTLSQERWFKHCKSPGTKVSLFLKANGVLPVPTLCELSLILPVPTLSELLKN